MGAVVILVIWRSEFALSLRVWWILPLALISFGICIVQGQSDRSRTSPVIGPLLSSQPEVDSGEILLGELNCASCHVADAAGGRLDSRVGPVLAAVGDRLTPQYLRSFISHPSLEKPGTTMPDLLHGFSAVEMQETVDALVHYLMSLKQGATVQSVGAESFRIQKGKELYHQAGFVACHSPEIPPSRRI